MKNFSPYIDSHTRTELYLLFLKNWTRKFAGKKVEIMRFRKIYTIPLKFVTSFYFVFYWCVYRKYITEAKC